VQRDATKAVVKCRSTAEKPQNGSIRNPGVTIDVIAHSEPQEPQAPALHRLGKYGVRIKSGYECLRAEDVGNGAGSNKHRAIGPVSEPHCQQRGEQQRPRDNQQPCQIEEGLQDFSASPPLAERI
jgi:hypothetical protein